MSAGLIALWVIAGWCGTPPWPWPPPPGPDPWPWLRKIVGVVGGLVGGWGYLQLWPVDGGVTGIDAAATAVGAFLGSILLSNIFGLIRRPGQAGGPAGG